MYRNLSCRGMACGLGVSCDIYVLVFSWQESKTSNADRDLKSSIQIHNLNMRKLRLSMGSNLVGIT
jgi:hypothetical protein